MSNHRDQPRANKARAGEPLGLLCRPCFPSLELVIPSEMKAKPQSTMSDSRFATVLTVILCPLAFFAVWMFSVYGTLVIMLVPIAFMIRDKFRNDRNA
jgi:hypothetical protein